MPKIQIAGTSPLKGFNDIFKNTIAPISNENIIQITLTELYPPDYHPFQVNDDLAMTRLVESVKQYGVREPCIARPRIEGGYELLSGNRRKRACEIAGINTLPGIVRELDDDSAVLVMIDSNLEQREKILPSERAWAYRMMMEALNHNGVKGEAHSHEIMTERTGIKKSQIFRIIRLTDLVITLLDKVDAGQLALNPAVELSYLTSKEQIAVAEAMEAYEVKPSLSQAIRLRKLKQDEKLTADIINMILSEEKKPAISKTNGIIRFRKYFPPETSLKQIEKVIVDLLADWKARTAG